MGYRRETKKRNVELNYLPYPRLDAPGEIRKKIHVLICVDDGVLGCPRKNNPTVPST